MKDTRYTKDELKLLPTKDLRDYETTMLERLHATHGELRDVQVELMHRIEEGRDAG